MHLLLTFANVDLYGSCAVGVLDASTYDFAWLPTTEFVDIRSILRAVPYRDRLYLLYRNSANAKRLMCLDARLSVQFVAYEPALDTVTDLFVDGDGVHALAARAVYRVSDDGLQATLTLERELPVPAGGDAVRAASFRGQLVYAVRERQVEPNNRFRIRTALQAPSAELDAAAGYDEVSDLIVLNGNLLVADAAKPALTRIGRGPAEVALRRGYIRGIGVAGGHLWVASNAWRYALRRFGRRASPAWVNRQDHAACYSAQIARLDGDLRVVDEIDVSHLGLEVSSIVPLPEASLALSTRQTHLAASRRALLLSERGLKETDDGDEEPPSAV